MNTEKLKTAATHFGWGLLASSWNGGWSAVAGVVGIDAVALTGADAAVTGAPSTVHVLGLHEMVSAFIGAFVLHAVLWIKSHPIPTTFETEPPFPAPK